MIFQWRIIINKFMTRYYILFTSACNFAKRVKADGEPYEIAYWLISFFNAVNLVSILLLLKFFIGINLEVDKFLFVVIILAPFFIINYYIFLKNRKYIRIISKLEGSTSYSYSLFYMILSILFFVIAGYINI